MKTLTRQDLMKKMARTLRKREVKNISLSVNWFDNSICEKIIKFTSKESLHLIYIDNVLKCYHFITNDYKGNAYWLNNNKGYYTKA